MIDVVVPTYRRPDRLRLCLGGLQHQSFSPDQIFVVVRDSDTPTREVMEEYENSKFRVVLVSSAGQVAALKAGVERSSAEIVAFTDDDAVARPEWLERMACHFADSFVGAVGGRDVVHGSAERASAARRVGLVNKWGRVTGNHHLGLGMARSAMILKGVNMAFRRDALRFPQGLRGQGAEVHNDAALSLWAKMSGWKVIYDPTILVDHYPAPRAAGHNRIALSATQVRDAAYNITMVILSTEAARPWRRLLYGFGVGARGTPGVLRAVAALSSYPPEVEVLRQLTPSIRGQIEGMLAYGRGERLGYDLTKAD
jgi:glycosyltransferase involved in cell wall biosynthesis